MNLDNMDLNNTVERSVEIQAPRETVFRYFTDSARWAKWWGAGSTIDPHVGGKVYIRHPNAVEMVGEIVELAPPDRIVFTWGHADGKPIPPGGSRVTIRLIPEGAGTRLQLVHEFADARVRDEYVQGWRFQLALFANVVADEVFANAGSMVDAWFDAWALAEPQARDAELRIYRPTPLRRSASCRACGCAARARSDIARAPLSPIGLRNRAMARN